MNRALIGVVFAAAAALVAVVCVLWALRAASESPEPPELFGDAATDAAFVTAALLLASAALVQALARPSRGSSAIAALTIGWCAAVPAIWSDAASLRFFATVAVALVPASLVHLAWRLPSARTNRPRSGGLVAAAYAAMAALSVSRLLVTDPRLDASCVVLCESATWHVVSVPALSRGLGVALLAASGLLAATAGFIAVRAVRHEHSPAARVALVALALCAGAELAWVAVPGARPLGGPPLWLAPGFFIGRALVFAVLGGILAWTGISRWRRRRALRRTAAELVAATPPRSLGAALSAGLHDPGLRLAFRAPPRWLDERGRAVTWPEEPEGTPTATIERNGAVIAAIRLSERDLDGSGLTALLGPAALLAIDIERTRAHALAELAALRSARQQLVESSETARRHAERDVHDGAQQRLIAASFELLQAAESARSRHAPARAEHFESLRAEVLETLQALRAVAHGMYPAILADAGLVPALEALARSSRATLSLHAPAMGRLRPAAEHTAYVAVAAAARDGDRVDVRLERRDECLQIRIHGPTSAPGIDVEDRVAALGGRIERERESWMLEVPCES